MGVGMQKKENGAEKDAKMMLSDKLTPLFTVLTISNDS